MNKIYCEICGKQKRVKRALQYREKCEYCGGKMGINIKGCSTLYSALPNDPVKVPRRFRPTLKDGSPCNKSAIRGALPCTGKAF